MTDDQQSAGTFAVEVISMLYSGAESRILAELATFPMTLMSPQLNMTITGPEELEMLLDRLRQVFRGLGIAGVRSEVRSVMMPVETMAIVSLKNLRLDAEGGSLGWHRSTYVLERGDAEWRFRALAIDDETSESDLRRKIEDHFNALMTERNTPRTRPANAAEPAKGDTP